MLNMLKRRSSELCKFTMNGALRLCAGLMSIALASCFKTNITHFGNCMGLLQDGETYPIEVFDVHYESKDGLVNTVHGKYSVQTVDKREKELLITIFRCDEAAKQQCNADGKSFVESLHCDQFKHDSKGIWYMISSAMSGSHCGEMTGTFDLHGVTLRNEHLAKYITDEPEKGRYKLLMQFRKKSENTQEIVRSCLIMEFDIL